MKYKFILYSLSFTGIVLIRTFLEFFSDPDWSFLPIIKVQSPEIIFVHYLFFWIFTFLLLTLFISYITKTNIVRVSKLGVKFSPIIFLAPTIDLILSRGEGYDLAYMLVTNWGNFLEKLVRFFGPLSSGGITPGMRIEIALIIIGIVYLSYKATKSWWRSALAGLGTYLIVFIAISWPFYFKIFDERFFYPQEIFGVSYNFDLKDGLLFIFAILPLLFLWLFRYKKQIALSVLKNIRIERASLYIAMVLIGVGVAQSYFGTLKYTPFEFLAIAAAVFAIVLAWFFAVITNDIFDRKTDEISNPNRPLVKGLVTPSINNQIAIVVFILSLTFAAFAGWQTFVMIIIYHAIFFLYSAPPFRLKSVPLLSNFIIALQHLIAIIIGYLLLQPYNAFNHFPPELVILILFSITLISILKDIKDVKGDKADGIMTIPIWLYDKYGENTARKIVGGIIAAVVISIPLILMKYFTWTMLAVSCLFSLLLYLLIAKFKIKDKFQILALIGFIIIIAAIIFSQGMTL